MADTDLAALLAEHGEMLQFHVGNGFTEPREAWAECICGEHLWDWQQFYNETPDEPEDAFRAHQAEVIQAAGWRRGQEEWGTKNGAGALRIDIESIARSIAAQHPRWRLVRRYVTDWEEA